MKTMTLKTGLVMVLLLAGSMIITAQRDGRYRYENSGPGHQYGIRQMKDSLRLSDTTDFRGMRHAGIPGPGYGMMQSRGRGFMPGPGYRNIPGRGHGVPGPGFGPGGMPGVKPFAPGYGRIENLPGLTDKQKQEIADLRKSQGEEMLKVRQELSARVQTMRDEHRKRMLDLLSDEQKKIVEERQKKSAGNTTGK